MGRKVFLFLSNFYLLHKEQAVYWGYISTTVPENIQMMKFRTSKLKNIILSIIFAILTVFNGLSKFFNNVRVGSYENLFLFSGRS